MSAARIVLIEDNPADILLVELALKEHGIPNELTKFTSGREAVSVLCDSQDSAGDTFLPDIILLDLNTPKSDGFQVFLQLKQSPRLAQVPIVILTSSSADSDMHRSSLLGVQLIQKPSDVNAFFATIGQAVKDMLAGSEARNGDRRQ